MRIVLASLVLVLAAGCAAEAERETDAGGGWDAARRDAGPTDAGGGEDAAPGDAGDVDGGGMDAGSDGGGLDAGPDVDAGADAGPGDAGTDAGGTDAGTCTVASAGDTLAFDGTDDLGEYPAEQILTPGAPLEAWERFGLTWDTDYLYVTMVSRGFEDEYEPVHVYLEAGASLGAASASTGKEYSSLTAELPFTPTHLVAVRRTSDSGSGGPYNGVYTPASSWSDRAVPLAEGTDYWVAGDDHTIAVRIAWADLGCPSELRLSAHVVHAETANEWKDVVPAGATPWATGGGAYYEIDLTADPAISGWVTVTP